MEAQEALVLKGQLKVVENTIERLKKDVDANSQEVVMLRSKLLLIEAHLGTANARLRHVERRAYKRGFKECKALAIQILPSAQASLL